MALLAGRQRRPQKMRGGTLDFVEYASQMRNDHHAELRCCAGSHPASLVESRDHPIQGIVLTKKEDFVFSPEVVVKICRRKGRGCCNVAHAGLRKSAHAKLHPKRRYLARRLEILRAAGREFRV